MAASNSSASSSSSTQPPPAWATLKSGAVRVVYAETFAEWATYDRYYSIQLGQGLLFPVTGGKYATQPGIDPKCEYRLLRWQKDGNEVSIEREYEATTLLRNLEGILVADLVIETENFVGFLLPVGRFKPLKEFRQTNWTASRAKTVVRHLLEALSKAHHHFCHRGIKLDRVWIDPSTMQIALVYWSDGKNIKAAADHIPQPDQDLASIIPQYDGFDAPEWFWPFNRPNPPPINKECDIWSVGCLALFLLTKQFHFRPPSAVDNPAKYTFLEMQAAELFATIPPELVGQEFIDFVGQTLNPDPSKRASADFLLKLPWLQQRSLEEETSEQALEDSDQQASTSEHAHEPEREYHPQTHLFIGHVIAEKRQQGPDKSFTILTIQNLWGECFEIQAGSTNQEDFNLEGDLVVFRRDTKSLVTRTVDLESPFNQLLSESFGVDYNTSLCDEEPGHDGHCMKVHNAQVELLKFTPVPGNEFLASNFTPLQQQQKLDDGRQGVVVRPLVRHLGRFGIIQLEDEEKSKALFPTQTEAKQPDDSLVFSEDMQPLFPYSALCTGEKVMCKVAEIDDTPQCEIIVLPDLSGESAYGEYRNREHEQIAMSTVARREGIKIQLRFNLAEHQITPEGRRRLFDLWFRWQRRFIVSSSSTFLRHDLMPFVTEDDHQLIYLSTPPGFRPLPSFVEWTHSESRSVAELLLPDPATRAKELMQAVRQLVRDLRDLVLKNHTDPDSAPYRIFHGALRHYSLIGIVPAPSGQTGFRFAVAGTGLQHIIRSLSTLLPVPLRTQKQDFMDLAQLLGRFAGSRVIEQLPAFEDLLNKLRREAFQNLRELDRHPFFWDSHKAADFLVNLYNLVHEQNEKAEKQPVRESAQSTACSSANEGPSQTALDDKQLGLFPLLKKVELGGLTADSAVRIFQLLQFSPMDVIEGRKKWFEARLIFEPTLFHVLDKKDDADKSASWFASEKILAWDLLTIFRTVAQHSYGWAHPMTEHIRSPHYLFELLSDLFPKFLIKTWRCVAKYLQHCQRGGENRRGELNRMLPIVRFFPRVQEAQRKPLPPDPVKTLVEPSMTAVARRCVFLALKDLLIPERKPDVSRRCEDLIIGMSLGLVTAELLMQHLIGIEERLFIFGHDPFVSIRDPALDVQSKLQPLCDYFRDLFGDRMGAALETRSDKLFDYFNQSQGLDQDNSNECAIYKLHQATNHTETPCSEECWQRLLTETMKEHYANWLGGSTYNEDHSSIEVLSFDRYSGILWRPWAQPQFTTLFVDLLNGIGAHDPKINYAGSFDFAVLETNVHDFLSKQYDLKK